MIASARNGFRLFDYCCGRSRRWPMRSRAAWPASAPFDLYSGLARAGNWPGAAKTVAEWFPIRERAFGMAIFNSGAAIGSVVAPPLIVWLSLAMVGARRSSRRERSALSGWRCGLCFMKHRIVIKWLGERGARLIREGRESDGELERAAAPKWSELLRYRQVWAIVLSRFLN